MCEAYLFLFKLFYCLLTQSLNHAIHDIDLSGFGLGTRSKRYAMIVEDGVVKYLGIEDSPPEHNKATAEKVLAALK